MSNIQYVTFCTTQSTDIVFNKLLGDKKFMYFKLIVFIFTAIFSSLSIAGEWRTPHTSEDIKLIRESGENLTSHFIGVTGEVGKVFTGYKGKPIFELIIEDKAGKEIILIGSLLKADLSTHDKIEILFDAILVNKKDMKVKKLTSQKYMGLGLCVVNKNKGYAKGAKPTQELCNKWYMTSFPSNYKDRN